LWSSHEWVLKSVDSGKCDWGVIHALPVSPMCHCGVWRGIWSKLCREIWPFTWECLSRQIEECSVLRKRLLIKGLYFVNYATTCHSGCKHGSWHFSFHAWCFPRGQGQCTFFPVSESQYVILQTNRMYSFMFPESWFTMCGVHYISGWYSLSLFTFFVIIMSILRQYLTEKKHIKIWATRWSLNWRKINYFKNRNLPKMTTESWSIAINLNLSLCGYMVPNITIFYGFV